MQLYRNRRIVLITLIAAGIGGVSEARGNVISSVGVGNGTTSSEPPNSNTSISTYVGTASGGGPFTGVEPPQQASCSDTDGCAWAGVLASPTPTTATEVLGTTNTSDGSLPEGSAGLIYDFYVSGPTQTVAVDINAVSISSVVSLNGCTSDCYYYANSLGEVVPAGDFPNQYFGFSYVCNEEFTFECTDDVKNYTSDMADEVTLTVDTGLGNELNLASNANVSAGSDVEVFSQMYLWITIDSSVADPGAYSITVDPNAGNSAPSSGAPEPSTGGLVAAGAAIGLAWRWRRISLAA